MIPALVTPSPALAGDTRRLLDPEGCLALLAEAGLDASSATPTYARLKPGVDGLVGMTLRGGSADGAAVSLPAHVRTFAEPGRAAEAAAKWSRRRPGSTPFGPAVALHPNGRSVILGFPIDRRLRRLPAVATMRKLKRELTGLPALGPGGYRVRGTTSLLTPLRYKPERRFVARLDLDVVHSGHTVTRPRVILRYLTGGRAERLAGVLERLRAAGLGAHLPDPVGSILDGSIHIERHVDGPELADALRAHDADAAALAEEVAVALCRLHAGDAPGKVDTSAVAIAEVDRALATIATVLPETGTATTQLRADVRRRLPAAGHPSAALHGDLHLHQVLMSERGAVLVDFDRSGWGDPRRDFGSLFAHLRSSVQADAAFEGAALAFEAVLARRCLVPAERDGLRFFVACGVVEQALLSFRRLDADWRERVPALLAVAARCLRHYEPGEP